MARNIYKKIASYLEDDLYVLLTSAYYGEQGRMDRDMKKIMHAKNTDCEYHSLNKVTMDGLTTVYEPMEPEYGLGFQVKTALDRDIIYKLSEESGEVVVITFIEVPLEEDHLLGTKLYVRNDRTVEGKFLNEDIMEQIVSVAGNLFGTEEYRCVSLKDRKNKFQYKVLFENMKFIK